MIHKITVAWLLSLFVWNVALAGVPSLLLCLHDDFLVHFQSKDVCESHCEHGHEHEAGDGVGFCETEGGCTDFELVGGVVVSTRVHESEAIGLPAFSFVAFNYLVTLPKFLQASAQLRPPLRGPPPSVHWLTDLYIQTTVLRV